MTASRSAQSDRTSTGTPAAPRRAAFATTRWSVVLRAGSGEAADSADALETLCGAYWYPLYAYVRRAGYGRQDAEDLTQAFFARFLEKHWVAAAEQERGRFRSFLLASLKHFLANEWDRARAQKRGGRVTLVSLDADTAETRLQHEPADTGTPDIEFDRRWALALLDTVLERLKSEYENQGKGELFQQLKATLGGERSAVPYRQLGENMQMSEGAVKVAVHRLRQRYRAILRTEIAQTVASDSDVDDELRHLFASLAR